MSSMIKIMMMMALVIMGVKAKTVTECRETDCKYFCANNGMSTKACSECVFRCSTASDKRTNDVDQRVICYPNCDVGCGTDNACHERCKKSCGYPPLMNLHL
ncbi:PREDICTED: uncharacterized protein LOC104758969 [Camelina sativa]|uniref:Uncharacterized protein LOC104758969 n=1 Tax=Camelina sativa TaxID=90675 RepID=A0ABM0X3Y8_CAMSA|nr:PREDICTED: uncharacterized protein LOC104758969 [Camelina sativa]